ncbi:MAG: multicopper oxidase domain-containing protein, partial [Caldibacillus thermoamylovorans]
PVTEFPRLNATEIWSLMNLTVFAHPIHIHLVQFQILDRRPFDLNRYNQTGEIQFTGPAVPPLANERGWKDTVMAPAGQITRIIMRFAPYDGDYVWHCHILEHEDYEMMRPYKVTLPRSHDN